MIDVDKCLPVKLPGKLYDRIEEKVASLYNELHISSVPIDPFEIAKRRGYIVKPFSSFDKKAQFFFAKMGLDATNYFDLECQTFVVCYDDSKTYERIRFTLMHEIGHIDMGHREESELARKIADYYAGYALAPSPIIGLMKCEDYIDIANRFNVFLICADICFQRFLNWLNIPTELKQYEKTLIGLFQNK